MGLVRQYFKVSVGCPLYDDAKRFLDDESKAAKEQKEELLKTLPKFSKYQTISGFYRIPICVGFKFDNPADIDTKVWRKDTSRDGHGLYYPNKRTKEGKAMYKWLRHFQNTTCWDVDKILGIDRTQVYGHFCVANIFACGGLIYVSMDSRHVKSFLDTHKEVEEITYSEYESAMINN